MDNKLKMTINHEALGKILSRNRRDKHSLDEKQLFSTIGEAVYRSWETLCSFCGCNNEICIDQNIDSLVCVDQVNKQMKEETK